MFTAPLAMDCKHTPKLTVTTSNSTTKKKKKIPDGFSLSSTPLTHVSLVNKFKALLDEAPSKPKVKYDSESVGCHEHVTAYYDYEWRMLYC